MSVSLNGTHFSPEDDTRNAGGVSHRTGHQQKISPEGGTKSCVALRAFLEDQPIPVAHATGKACDALRAKGVKKQLEIDAN